MQYLAVFESPSGDVCQGVVRLPAASRRRVWYPDRWFDVLARLIRAHGALRGCAMSVRTSLRRNECEQLLLFRTPAAQSETLRIYVTGFIQLLALVEESVAVPRDEAEHNRFTQSWPQFLCRVDPGGNPGEPWYAADFRVHPFLPELLDEAAAQGCDFFYQANLEPAILSPEHERRARKNAVAIEGQRGAPLALRALEEALLHRPAGAVTLVEEYVGSSSAAGVDWLRATLDRRFVARFGPARLPTPGWTFERHPASQFVHSVEGLAGHVALGIHESAVRPFEVHELASQAAERTEIDAIFAWAGPMRRWFEPPLAAQKAELRTAYDVRENAEAHEAAAVAGQVAHQNPPLVISETPGDYAFISYRHADFARIAPVLSGLNAAGIPYWFDRGITAGAHWLEVLQDRLTHSRALVLFLSRQVAGSRYVQLETTYAYSLGKTIVPVRLDDIDLKTLPGGLGFLLNSLHAIDAGVEEVLRHLHQQGFPRGR